VTQTVHMKRHIAMRCLLTAFLFLAASRAHAQASYPELGEDYWIREQGAAKGKLMRGAGLSVLGLAAVVPTAIWIDRAVDNPQKFAALGAVTSIAALSMTLHGFNSIGFGMEQRGKATRFARLHRDAPQSVDVEEERAFVLYSRKKTAAKVLLFGSVLAAQSAILLTNGIVLSVEKSQGDSIGGAKLWPSYTFGGLMLAAGVAVIASSAKRYRDDKTLEPPASPDAQALSLQPWLTLDETTGASGFGLTGQMLF